MSVDIGAPVATPGTTECFTSAESTERMLWLAQTAAGIGVWDWHVQEGVTRCSEFNRQLYGLRPGCEMPQGDEFLCLIHSDDRERMGAALQHGFRTGHYEEEFRVIWPDGSVHWLLGKGEATVDPNGRPARMIGINMDISQRKMAEERMRQLARALHVLSAGNRAVVRAGTEERLLREICQIIAEDGGYAIAAIGFAGDDERKTVQFVEASGPGKAYLDSITITWADEPLGRGPVGLSIRTGMTVVVNETANDPAFSPWRKAVERFGLRSVISLPLQFEGGIIGALVIYSAEPDAFYGEERRLLEELAGDVSYGIEARRHRMERARTLESLQCSESQFRAVFNRAGDGIFIADLQGRFLNANEVACRRLGYSHDEITQLNVTAINPPEDAALAADRVANTVRNGGYLYEATHVCKDGGRIPVEIRASLFDYRGSRCILAVARDITERKHAEAEHVRRTEELERAKAEAEAASCAKGQFLTHISHEMRTPMNGIIGTTSLLLETRMTPEQEEFAETIRKSSDGLLTLINDILDLSKIEARRLELAMQPFDLVDCLSEVGDLMASQARLNGLEYRFHPQGEQRPVVGDAGRIRQIVLNLLGNAIKFTTHGHVLLRVISTQASESRGLYQISVSDTGIGIPPDKLPLLFRKFTQVDSSLIRKHEGAGLGLAISRELAALMGGSLSVRSEPGRGSEFTLTLTLPYATGVDRVDKRHVEEIAQLAPRSRRVLLAEDNPVNQKLGARLLEKLGCCVDVAANGREAVDMATRAAYDLILMDCRMPEMDGITATRKIRSHEGDGPRSPIVALTAHAVSGAREECLCSGMDDFLPKPVRLVDLERALLRWSP